MGCGRANVNVEKRMLNEEVGARVRLLCARRDLNPQPFGPKPNALSIELRAHVERDQPECRTFTCHV
jgi:hypothetical protein